MKSSFCIDLQRFMLIPTKFPLSQSKTLFAIFLPFCIFMQNRGKNALVLTFFSFFAKHVCKVKTSSFEYCKHGIHEA